MLRNIKIWHVLGRSIKKWVDEEFHPGKSGACGYYLKRSLEPKCMLFD